MEDLQFDHRLRELVAGTELPCNAGLWQQLSDRLDQRNNRHVIIIPARRRREIPVKTISVTALAASLLLAFFWIGNKMDPKQAPEVAKQNLGNHAIEKATTTNPVAVPTPAQIVQRGSAASLHNQKSLPERSYNAQNQSIAQNSTIPSVTPANTDTTTASDRIAGLSQGQKEQPKTIDWLQDTRDEGAGPEERRRKLALGIQGSYNLGSDKAAFSLGVNIQKPISGALQFETGIALVSGAFETHTASAASGLGDVGTVTKKEYVASANRLVYLQAAPGISYRLNKSLRAGAGVDAQRLLGSADNTAVVNEEGALSQPQPTWDFGVTGKMDYRLFSRVHAGISYRKSLSSFNGSVNAVPRDYMMLQLGYQIFK